MLQTAAAAATQDSVFARVSLPADIGAHNYNSHRYFPPPPPQDQEREEFKEKILRMTIMEENQGILVFTIVQCHLLLSMMYLMVLE